MPELDSWSLCMSMTRELVVEVMCSWSGWLAQWHAFAFRLWNRDWSEAMSKLWLSRSSRWSFRSARSDSIVSVGPGEPDNSGVSDGPGMSGDSAVLHDVAMFSGLAAWVVEMTV